MEEQEILQELSKESLKIKFSKPIPANQSGGRQWYRIKVSLDGDRDFIQTSISEVVYRTHSTFPEKLQEIVRKNSDNFFAMTLKVWGRFVLRATVYLQNGDTVELSKLLPSLSG